VALLVLLGVAFGVLSLAFALLRYLALDGTAQNPALYQSLLGASALAAIACALLAIDRQRALVAARRSERSFRDLYESINEGVFRSTLGGRMISANPALVRLNGYGTEEELIRCCNDIATEWYVDPNRRAEIHTMVLERGEVENVVSEVFRHKTRERIWIEESVKLVRDAKTGEPLYYQGNVREVTETVRRLKLQDRYDKIASIMSGCLYQNRMAPDGKTSMPYASVGLYHIVGLRPEEVAEDSSAYRDLIHPDDFDRVTGAILHSRDTLTPLQCEYRVRLADGAEKWVLAHSVPEREPDGSTLWHGYLVDASEKKRSEEKIYELAYFDTLTRLPNRVFLGNRLHRILALDPDRERPRALLFVDLDHFKVLNDTKGHHVGDLLLCEVTRRINACAGAEALVARLGGDEFVVLLDRIGGSAAVATAQAHQVGDRILAAIDQPFRIADDTFQTTASIGAVVFSASDHDADAVLKHADLAMYEAKAAGRGTLRFYEEEMQVAAADRLALTSELRRAPEEGGLLLHYQPIVGARGDCIGAEALLRWNHPTRGLISAGEFIALAERSGFTRSIDQWVLRAACATLKEWERDPLTRNLSLSVNVSAREMGRTQFADVVERALSQSGARPGRLTLELTEHVMLDDFESVNAVMRHLQALGLSFALDDFGTGYSSLSYLKRLPIDTLKIDRSFVRDLESDESDRQIVQTILNMAKSLKISVVAEGVETDLQAVLLRQLGCHAFQGYLFGRPMPEGEFRAYLEAAKRAAGGSDQRSCA
jgi:diguanylate cyclase (GGDEF)-like protein/PAS domain S-box-containing protein